MFSYLTPDHDAAGCNDRAFSTLRRTKNLSQIGRLGTPIAQTSSCMAEQKQKNSFNGRAVFAIVVVALVLVGAQVAWIARGKFTANGAEPQPLVAVHLEPFVVNLADRDEKTFLRAGIDLGIEKPPTKKSNAPTEYVAVVRDAIIGVLSNSKAQDLLTPEGKKKLKEDLVKALNDRAPELKVHEVYFSEFLVQR